LDRLITILPGLYDLRAGTYQKNETIYFLSVGPRKKILRLFEGVYFAFEAVNFIIGYN
jgi:hypothetical protein